MLQLLPRQLHRLASPWRRFSSTASKIPLTSVAHTHGVPVGADGEKDWSRPLEVPAARRFVGQNAVVTGSRMGVGFTIARALAAEGANVCLVDLRDSTEAVKVIQADGGEGSITQVRTVACTMEHHPCCTDLRACHCFNCQRPHDCAGAVRYHRRGSSGSNGLDRRRAVRRQGASLGPGGAPRASSRAIPIF